MSKSRFNKIIDKMIDSDFTDSTSELSEDELTFLQKNPQLLSKISDSSFIKKKYIFRLFAISVIMAVTAKSFEYFEWLSQFKIANDLLTNVLFAISMEMLGATIIAYFLEITLEKRVKKNQDIITKILERINEAS